MMIGSGGNRASDNEDDDPDDADGPVCCLRSSHVLDYLVHHVINSRDVLYEALPHLTPTMKGSVPITHLLCRSSMISG